MLQFADTESRNTGGIKKIEFYNEDKIVNWCHKQVVANPGARPSIIYVEIFKVSVHFIAQTCSARPLYSVKQAYP